MIKNVLENIGGIGLYGVISICLFCLVFAGAFLRAMALKQSVCDTLSALPLTDESEPKSGGPGIALASSAVLHALVENASGDPRGAVHDARGRACSPVPIAPNQRRNQP